MLSSRSCTTGDWFLHCTSDKTGHNCLACVTGSADSMLQGSSPCCSYSQCLETSQALKHMAKLLHWPVKKVATFFWSKDLSKKKSISLSFCFHKFCNFVLIFSNLRHILIFIALKGVTRHFVNYYWLLKSMSLEVFQCVRTAPVTTRLEHFTIA